MIVRKPPAGFMFRNMITPLIIQELSMIIITIAAAAVTCQIMIAFILILVQLVLNSLDTGIISGSGKNFTMTELLPLIM